MATISEIPKYEAYKNSGVKWLSGIPIHWDEYPLCAKAKLKSVNKQKLRKSCYLFIWIRGSYVLAMLMKKRTNVTSLDLSKYQLVEVGDFVLNNQQAWRGSVGVSAYQGIVSPAYLVLSLSEELNSRFANYLFRDGSMVSHYLVCSKGVGTIQRNLYWPQLKRIPIYLPPIDEQASIANFLDIKTEKIDGAISIKIRQIALLKERKQIIIQKAITKGLNPDAPMKYSGVDCDRRDT